MPPKRDLPKNWPSSIPYLSKPTCSERLTKGQLTALRTQPKDVPEVPASTPLSPCAAVRITLITSVYSFFPYIRSDAPSDTKHPACGQRGLFATKDLPPGSFILCYIGELHSSVSDADKAEYGESDYDLTVDREADIAVDAREMGNEARFINDFRRVPAAPGAETKKGKEGQAVANAEFREMWDGRPGRGERCMGVFVLCEGNKRKSQGVKKGEEILVSYGRGFWDARKNDKEEWEDENGDEKPYWEYPIY